MYKNFLPSNLVVSLFIIPIFSIILFFILKDKVTESSVGESSAKFNLTKAVEEELTKKDGDSDGLLDWEERLYETDIDNPDSDGDGILDGLEVKTGTNPTDPFNKEFRKSEIKKVINGENEYNYRNDTNLTQTDKFSRDLFVKIAELKGSNLINNVSAQNRIIEEVLEKNIKDFVPLEIKNSYTKKDLKTSNSLSVGVFQEVFSNTYKSQKWDLVEDDIYLLAQFAESGDTKIFEKLSNNFSVYEKYKEDLLKISVPEEIYSFYLQYINSLHEYSYILKMIIDSREDPIGLVNHVQSLRNSLEKMEYTSQIFSFFFTNNNI